MPESPPSAAATAACVLELRGVNRHFEQGGERVEILRGVDFVLRPGELVALVGPSGSGKTTLLQIAGLLDTPESGTVAIGGMDATRAADAARTGLRRGRIGFIYQFHHLLPEFTALENVMMPLLVAQTPPAKARAKALELLASLGLAGRVSHRPSELSGGEQQRVAIARALANDPLLLLADEPTGNLDPHSAETVWSLFLNTVRQKGVAALIATHNHELAHRMDRVVTMEAGRLIPVPRR